MHASYRVSSLSCNLTPGTTGQTPTKAHPAAPWWNHTVPSFHGIRRRAKPCAQRYDIARQDGPILQLRPGYGPHPGSLALWPAALALWPRALPGPSSLRLHGADPRHDHHVPNADHALLGLVPLGQLLPQTGPGPIVV